MTPMVRKNFEDDPGLREIWERENMFGRLSEPSEYRGAALFLLSDASSFMTGSQVGSSRINRQSSNIASSLLTVGILLGRNTNLDSYPQSFVSCSGLIRKLLLGK